MNPFGVEKRKSLFAFLLAIGMVGVSAPVFAQETDDEESMEEEATKTDVEQGEATMGAQTETPVTPEATAFPTYEFQGWVDTSMYWDNQDTSMANVLGYQMAQVGLRMGHKINENYGGFVQLNAFAAANDLNLRAREAYGYYETSEGGFKILAGKFYAPIGFELADPPDLYQFSNSLVFANLIPTELVGVLGAIQLTDSIDLKLYTSGPWDDDVAAMAIPQKNVGGRLGLGFGDTGGVGLSAVGGIQGDGTERIAIDLDASITAVENLLIGFEANVNMIKQYYGANPVTDVATGALIGADESGYAMPMGFLVMGNYAFTDLFNLTLRYDMVIDAPLGDIDATNGQFTSVPGAALFGLGPAGEALTLSSITVGPNFHLTDGWDIFTEFRYDMASDDVFLVDGNLEAAAMSGAVELIYQF